MSVNYYDKTTGRIIGVAGGQRLWIGSKAAHDAEVVADKMPYNVLVGILETGLFYRDKNGVETLITTGSGDNDVQVITMPIASEDNEARVVQYIGTSTQDYTHGYFYECINNNGTYIWQTINVQESGDGEQIQFYSLPTASSENVSKIYQYIGTTNDDYTNGYFYKCVRDTSTNPATYKWQQWDTQPESVISTENQVGIVKPDNVTTFVKTDGTIYTKLWAGTLGRYYAVRDLLPEDTTIIILDYDGIPDDDYYVNGVKIVSWTTGTDQEIVDMIAGADAGLIDLYDYWEVGDKRTVHLSSMDAGDTFANSMDAQDISLVLMNKGYMGQQNIHFVVGQENCLSEPGIMSNATYHGVSWEDSLARADINNIYYNAFPSTLKPIFKEFEVKTTKADGENYGNQYLVTTTDRFALFGEIEVFGAKDKCLPPEIGVLQQIEYYTNANARKKTMNGQECDWWERSPGYWHPHNCCEVYRDGSAAMEFANTENGIAPFGCI